MGSGLLDSVPDEDEGSGEGSVRKSDQSEDGKWEGWADSIA
jgi:hypothetical protein